jgi:hypothetical protein
MGRAQPTESGMYLIQQLSARRPHTVDAVVFVTLLLKVHLARSKEGFSASIRFFSATSCCCVSNSSGSSSSSSSSSSS